MSLETSIAQLTQQAGLLMDLPQQVADEALSKMAALSALYQSHLSSMSTDFFVNQTTGVDTNAGTLGSPFKSVEKALALTPPGGTCRITLQANYHFSTQIYLGNRRVVIRSDSVVRHRVTFEVVAAAAPGYRSCKGFLIAGGDSILFLGVTIVWPALPPALAAMLPDSSCCLTTASYGHFDIAFYGCDLEIPATPANALLQSLGTVSLYVLASTFTGAITNGNGRWATDFTNTAGTSSATQSQIHTNLATI